MTSKGFISLFTAASLLAARGRDNHRSQANAKTAISRVPESPNAD